MPIFRIPSRESRALCVPTSDPCDHRFRAQRSVTFRDSKIYVIIHKGYYQELEADIRKKIPELEELAKTSEPWSRLIHHAELSAQLAHTLSLYADGNMEVRNEMEKLKAMAYEKWDEAFEYMDTLFYTTILGMVTDTSASDFAREVETEN